MESYNDGIPAIIEPTCRIRFLTDPRPEEEYIAITVSRMKELLASEMKLCALESGGVDNWSWYSDALCDYLREVPGWYDKNFWDWARNEKAADQTVEEFVEEMSFEDFAEYEVSIM